MRGLLLIALLVSFSPSVVGNSSDLFLHSRELQLYHTPENACGPLAAFLALRFHGRKTTLSEVADAIPIGVRGASMLQISNYLRSQGLDTVGVELTDRGLNALLHDVDGACAIAWLNEGHWVLVVPGDGKTSDFCDYPNWMSTKHPEFTSGFSERVILITSEDAEQALRGSVSERWLNTFLAGLAAIMLLVGLLLQQQFPVKADFAAS
jgi:ABC-type bacteriocin/lantibiotic exporter with double-glycine peptidase domain